MVYNDLFCRIEVMKWEKSSANTDYFPPPQCELNDALSSRLNISTWWVIRHTTLIWNRMTSINSRRQRFWPLYGKSDSKIRVHTHVEGVLILMKDILKINKSVFEYQYPTSRNDLVWNLLNNTRKQDLKELLRTSKSRGNNISSNAKNRKNKLVPCNHHLIDVQRN